MSFAIRHIELESVFAVLYNRGSLDSKLNNIFPLSGMSPGENVG